MDEREAAAHWEANAEAWTAHARAGYDRYRDLVNTPGFLALLPDIAGLHGLDIGCGEGVFQEQLRGAAGRYLGVDFEEPIRQAQHKVSDHVRFVVGDMNEFTTSERFDVIVFNESIYYLHDLMSGLARYEPFLADDGVILISMHGKERNDALWAQVDARYRQLDAVTLTNHRGIRWTTKALVPPNSRYELPPQAP